MNIKVTVYKIYKSYFNRSDITETKRGIMKTEQCYKKRGEKYNAQDAAINAVEKEIRRNNRE